MAIREELKGLFKGYIKKVVLWFILLNSIVLGYYYLDLYLNRSLAEIHAMFNGIILTNYYFWFVGVGTISIVNHIGWKIKDDKIGKVYSYYLYQIWSTLCLIIAFQLIVHVFLPIGIMDSVKMLTTVLLFNIIYYFILIVFIMIVKNVITKRETILFIIYGLLNYGFIIAPAIKGTNTSNIFIKIISWFDLYGFFGGLYLFIASSISQLSFYYHEAYTDIFFNYLSQTQVRDVDNYKIYFHKELVSPLITLLVVIMVLLSTWICTKIVQKNRKQAIKN